MATPFQQEILRIAAGYLTRGPMGSAFAQATGIVCDFYQERLLQGIRAKWPLQCNANNLPFIASEYGVKIYASEPLSSQRYRLSQWKQLARHKGSQLGAMMNVQPFFLGVNGLGTIPTIKAVHQQGDNALATWHTLSPFDVSGAYRGLYIDSLPPPNGTGFAGLYTMQQTIPSNWNFDSQPTKWSRVFYIVHLPTNFASAQVYDGGGVYDAGLTYDGVSSQLVADLTAGLLEMHAAHERVCCVILTTLQPTDNIPGLSGHHAFDPNDVSFTLADGSTTLPVGNWGTPVNPGMSTPSRPPWASFIYLDNP